MPRKEHITAEPPHRRFQDVNVIPYKLTNLPCLVPCVRATVFGALSTAFVSPIRAGSLT